MAATGDSHGRVALWAEGTDAGPIHWQGHARSVWCVTFSPDGRTLATGASNGVIRLWDIPSGVERGELRRGSRALAPFATDGTALAVASQSGPINLWDSLPAGPLRDSEPRAIRGVGGAVVHALALAPGGTILATATSDRLVYLWDLLAGSMLASFPTSGVVTTLVFAPNGALLAAGGGRSILLWDVQGRRPRALLAGMDRPVETLAFALEGKALAALGLDGHIRLWDAGTGDVWVGKRPRPPWGAARSRKEGRSAAVLWPHVLATGTVSGDTGPSARPSTQSAAGD